MTEAFPAARGTAFRSPIRLGLIGCGNIWRTVYRPILGRLRDRVTITALCDLSSRAIEESASLLPGARGYTDSEILFREEPLDAVMVLTSERANAPTSLAALRAGLPIFLEKPPAVSVSELQRLAEAETAAGPGRLYTAFNRRHTLLFRDWRVPEDARLRSVRGALRRQGRAVSTFPFTAIHLIDSAQFFSGRLLAEARSVLGDGECGPVWYVKGILEGGATCDLTLVPDGRDYAEHLVFETEERIWELHFPHRSATQYQDGLLVSRPVSPATENESPAETIHGDRRTEPFDAMGNAPCVRDFLTRLRDGRWETSLHRLHRCGPSIALLEQMLGQA